MHSTVYVFPWLLQSMSRDEDRIMQIVMSETENISQLRRLNVIWMCPFLCKTMNLMVNTFHIALQKCGSARLTEGSRASVL